MFKKKAFFILLIAFMFLTSCTGKTNTDTSSVEQTSSVTEQSEAAEMKTPDFTNLTYDNGSGRMADTDGPAYVVYSKKGCNKATADILLSGVELNNVRKNNNRFVNAYIFLGIDVYDSDGNWINCADTGLCYSGRNGFWHLFYNIINPRPKTRRAGMNPKSNSTQNTITA
jgi:hypothetical protein